MPKKQVKKSKKASTPLKKGAKAVSKKTTVKANSKGKMSTKPTTKSTKGKSARVGRTQASTAKAEKLKKVAKKVGSKKTAVETQSKAEKKKVGRPAKSTADKVLKSTSSPKLEATPETAPRKRGRPPKIKTPEMIAAENEANLNLGPKKRGRKSKAELEAIAKGLDPRTVQANAAQGNAYAGGVVPLGQPIKRKRGRPRKNEQYGVGGAVLNSELMARGIRRFGVPVGGTDIPIAKYSWSAETGEHLSVKTANFSSADSGTEISTGTEVEFAKGDKVVYPAHGLGVIQAIQSRLVSGAQQKFYLILILETQMKIMVPVGQAETVGLRRVVDHSTVDRVYAILKDKNVAIDNQTWNRRYREYSQKIKTGSVLEIASVIRDLTVLKVEKELSFNERRMLDTAQGLLVKELSIAKSASEDLIKEELEQICQF